MVAVGAGGSTRLGSGRRQRGKQSIVADSTGWFQHIKSHLPERGCEFTDAVVLYVHQDGDAYLMIFRPGDIGTIAGNPTTVIDDFMIPQLIHAPAQAVMRI